MSTDEDPIDAWLTTWRRELDGVVLPSSELTKRVMYFGDVLRETMRRELSKLELTEAEFDVVIALRRSGAPYRMKPKDLVRSLMLSSGGTTNVTHRLVARGLVERQNDPADARSTFLHLTEQGVRVAEHAVQVNARAHDALFEGVPVEVVDEAAVALRAVFAAVDALRDHRRDA